MQRREEMDRHHGYRLVLVLGDKNGGARPLRHPRKTAGNFTRVGRISELTEHARQRGSIAGDGGANGEVFHRLQVSAAIQNSTTR